MRQRMKLFVLILLLSVNAFARPQSDFQFFDFEQEDLINYRVWSKSTDEDGDTYIHYPNPCFKEDAQVGRNLSSFVKNYYTYRDPTYLVAEKKCGTVQFDYLSESKTEFNLDLFPVDVKLVLEVYYFSDTGHAPYSVGNYSSGVNQTPAQSSYRTFNNPQSDINDLFDRIGIEAKLSQNYPIAIGSKFLRDVSASYNIAKIRYQNSYVSIPLNIEGGWFNRKDYSRSTGSLLKIIQYRYPMLFSKSAGIISTIYSIRLLLPSTEAAKICSKYVSDYFAAKAEITEAESYGKILKDMAAQSSPDIYLTIVSQYYKSQKEIENTIGYIHGSLPDSIEKDMLVEGLEAVSLLRGNECLKTLTLDMLQKNPEISTKQINGCLQNKKITIVQKTLLDQLVSLNKKEYSVSSNFESEIRSVAAKAAGRRVYFLNTKKKFKDFYYKGIPNYNLQGACSQVVGADRFNEIMESN